MIFANLCGIFLPKKNKIITIFRKYINCQLFRTMISTTIFAAIPTKIQRTFDETTTIKNTENDAPISIRKELRNGQVLIMCGGKMYNLQGVEVK